MKNILMTAIAKITRCFHPRGSERILRLIYHPDHIISPIHAVIKYWKDLKISVDTSFFLEWKIFFFGSYEPNTIAFIENTVRPGDVCVEVGANVGAHTLILSRMAGWVQAFEPCSEPRRRLNKNLQLNNIKNVTVYPTALSDVPGVANLLVQEESSTKLASATLHKDSSLGVIDQEIVSVRTLDSYVFQRVDFLKIDTEGGDLRVLCGAENTLRRCKPTILFEYSYKSWLNADSSFSGAISFLRGIGYSRILSLGKNGKVIPLENKESQNIVAFP